MTDEQILQWKKERDIARAIADEASRKVALEKVYDHRDEMQMTCICHQARRQKEMAEEIRSSRRDIETLKEDIIPLKRLNRQAVTLRERFRGAVTLWRILAALGMVSVGALVSRLLNLN